MSDIIRVNNPDLVRVTTEGADIISIGTQGPPGATGSQGPAGQGVPTGGTASQLLTKVDATDYNTQWADLVAAQIPTLDAAKIGTGIFDTARIPTLPISQITNLQTALDGKQPLDADLTAIAALAPADNDVIQRIAGAWVNRTMAQLYAALGLGTMATQNANNVSITGGAISGLTSFANNGNTTLGDASGDTTTINGTAVTIPNGLTISSPTLVQLLFEYAKDATVVFGRVRLNSRISNIAFFSHYGMAGGGEYALSQNSGGLTSINAATGSRIDFKIADLAIGNWRSAGLKIGDNDAATSVLHAVSSGAGTNDTQNVLTIGRNSSGTPAANFTERVQFQLETSTTENIDAASIEVSHVVATHASRTERMVFKVNDAGGAREALRLQASGSAPMIGFLGAAAAVRQTGGALTAGATYGANEQTMLQRVFDMARTFGLLD